ncbi:MAG: 30S ribosomal protein S20 [Proteobacteria bacterium]|nr:30S ribosomal protein S20 [Pseudomonadota bacterium]
MAHHKSAIKRMNRTLRRTEINKARRTRIRTGIKKVEAAVMAGDSGTAKEALQAVQPVLMRGVGKGIVKSNTASRKLSRLSASIKALS